jgi:hypothetical protein
MRTVVPVEPVEIYTRDGSLTPDEVHWLFWDRGTTELRTCLVHGIAMQTFWKPDPASAGYKIVCQPKNDVSIVYEDDNAVEIIESSGTPEVHCVMLSRT